MKFLQFRLTLLGLALGVLFTLIIAPQTRWLLRLQTLTCLRVYHPLPNGPYYTWSLANDRHRYAMAAANHPTDFAIQYAAVPITEGSDKTLAGLRGLIARFPDQPALYANILRYELINPRWSPERERPEENVLYGLPVQKAIQQNPIEPEVLAVYESEAAAGERLDSTNAYFPLLHSIGLFAAHHDVEGLAAFKRASNKSYWKEYHTEDIESRWRLQELAFGDPTALGRSNIAASFLLPQLGRIRAAARLVRFKAFQAERGGHWQEGLQLREELRRIGDLMRSQPDSYIGSLVGIAVAALAASDPGGTIPPKSKLKLTTEQIKKQNLDAYCAYVTRLGRPEIAARTRAEEAAGRKVAALADLNDLITSATQPLVLLGAWWLADLTALANILWLLVFGGLTSVFGLSRWADRSSGGKTMGEKAVFSRHAILDRQTVFSKSIAVIAMSVAIVFFQADFSQHLFGLPNWHGGIMHLIEELCFLLAVFALPPAIAVYLMRHGLHLPRFSRLPSQRVVGAALLAGVCVYGIYTFILWQAGSLADFVNAVRLLTQSGSDTDDSNPQVLIHWLSILAVLTMPLLLGTIFSIAACIRRVPISVGLVQGFRVAAMPAACVLLLIYGGLLLGTLHQERIVNAQVWHWAHDDGPYLATQAGQLWPGPVR